MNKCRNCYGNCSYGTNSCDTCRCVNNYYINQAPELRGIQLQLEQQDALEIKAGKNILFNKNISQLSHYIGYDNATGTICIMQSGTYYIDWWVATESIMGGDDVFVAFSIISSQGHNIKASNYNTTGQITGNALISLCASPHIPTCLTLANATDGNIAFGQVPIKANLSIFQVAHY